MVLRKSKNKGGKAMLFAYHGKIMEIPNSFLIENFAEQIEMSGKSREWYEGRLRNETLNIALSFEDCESSLEAYLEIYEITMEALDLAFPA